MCIYVYMCIARIQNRIKIRLQTNKQIIFRYDPNVDVPMDVEGQNDRVIFIKSIAQFMVS